MNTIASRRIHRLLHESPSWLTSMVFHMILLLVLAMLTMPEIVESTGRTILMGPIDDLTVDDWHNDPLPKEIPLVPYISMAAPAPPQLEAVEFYEGVAIVESDSSSNVRLDPIDGELPKGDDPLARVPGSNGTQRIQDRDKGFDDHRGTPEGRAVALALKWLAQHQMPDGGWSFHHAMHPECHGQCRNPGTLSEARSAATAMALLPFLGAGQTHGKGQYRQTVKRGLYFLVGRMKVDPHGGALNEPGGRMYSHGLASITLCEAYAMTHDRQLYLPSQQAVNFICYAQDPVGGGWRYEPRQRGDTSVLGWQIMALKSGYLGYLRVPTVTMQKAMRYLDTVQYESGARYGYTDTGRGSPATTAIGLLCRMYLGWKKDHPALERGVQWIDEQGPSANDMYYNYYATQVMHHWSGSLWRRWDSVLRPQLVGSQAQAGHETGSWLFKHHHAERGGRLFCTALAAMTLEIYYRQQPLYRNQSVEDDFLE